MADDSYLTSFVNALKGIPLSEAMPFGAGATPQGDPTALSQGISSVATLPKRAIDAAQQDVQHYSQEGMGGDYQPQVTGPAAETAMALAGAGMPMAEEGAAGIFGGKLAKGANLDKMAQAQRMVDKGVDRGIARQITGWHQGPDAQWRFEIPDESSRMMNEGSGPAGVMFQHSPLYQAYPGLRDVHMYSEINPNYPDSTGSWDLKTGLAELSSQNKGQARLGALHELQHAVQHIEGFTPGTTTDAFVQALKDLSPEKLEEVKKEQGGKIDPFNYYWRTAGEVEPRNVEQRADFNPRARYDIHPWETHDTPYDKQLLIPPITGDYHILNVLRSRQK